MPDLVCTTEGDDISSTAGTFADNLFCPKEFVTFGTDDDVSGHGEMSGRSGFHRRVFDWLDEVLGFSGLPVAAAGGRLAASRG